MHDEKRVEITLDGRLWARICNYRYSHNHDKLSGAVSDLILKGLAIESWKAHSGMPLSGFSLARIYNDTDSDGKVMIGEVANSVSLGHSNHFHPNDEDSLKGISYAKVDEIGELFDLYVTASDSARHNAKLTLDEYHVLSSSTDNS